MKYIDEIRRKRSIVASSKAFVIRQIGEGRRLPRKLLDFIRLVILQIATPEKGMLAVLSETIVHAGDIGVKAQMNRRIETKTKGVQSVSDRIVIRCRILVKDCQHRWIRSDVKRVKCSNPSCIEF